jgi:hypothetical protein
LTSDEEELKRLTKTVYLCSKMKGMSSYALVIKLCDRLHNVSDNPTAKMLTDTSVIITYLEKNRKLTKTHKAIIDEIRKYIS